MSAQTENAQPENARFKNAQSESGSQSGEDSGQLNKVRAGKAPHGRWLFLAIALIVAAILLVSGIWSRVRANKSLRAETAQVPNSSVSRVASTNDPRPGNYPSGKRPTIHHLTDLFANEWLFEALVFRHREPRKAGPIACRNRDAGSRPGTPASSKHSSNSAGKSRPGPDH